MEHKISESNDFNFFYDVFEKKKLRKHIFCYKNINLFKLKKSKKFRAN